ncbi:hypothetical protein BO82DRAFT_181533 [Aspergillus uvarum CBS 121591]|uniref:Uncharacterized protein n=1 Tax=Aspergillus uvarum CBS 121591 TaxID=1448315 RepID=A0A319CME1_9EURO|nr:hypothetical protein BO82DRAFT_181533 [Aspergillus uvarum CBS 121591]PYH85201.1 hypothetical protein BO82DRAFT_181533 [Aspergillus uvarum CBS 121591]
MITTTDNAKDNDDHGMLLHSPAWLLPAFSLFFIFCKYLFSYALPCLDGCYMVKGNKRRLRRASPVWVIGIIDSGLYIGLYSFIEDGRLNLTVDDVVEDDT